MKNYDVIIVGAGCSGLSTGALLAQGGYSVLVLEKQETIGGRSRLIEKENFTIDYGIHANRFGKQGKCAEVLQKLNREIDFIRMGKLLVFKDGEFSIFPSHPWDIIKTFITKSRLLSWKSKRKLLKIFLSIPFARPKNLISFSFYDFLKNFSSTQEIFDIAKLFCGTVFICPDIKKVPLLEVSEFFKNGLFVREKVAYPKDGWKGILDILKEEIEKRGKILTNCEVRKVEITNNNVSKIITDKDEYTAKAYICTIPFGNIEDIIDLDKLSPQLRKYAKEVEPTSGVTLDFILSKSISDKNGVIVTQEPFTLGYFTSNITKQSKEKQLGTWYFPLLHEEIKNRDYAKSQINVLKDLLQKMFPNIWDNLLWERAMILDVVDGAVPKIGQSWKERPQFTSNISNLFFAGDSTGGWGWGGEIAFDSAIKCGEIVKNYIRG